MDQQCGSSVHMTAFPMQSHHQHASHHHYSSHGQYQQVYTDYPESCYQSPAFHEASYHGDQYGYHPTSSVPYGTGIESYLDPKYASNPAAFASRLPYLPFHAAAVAAYGMYDYSFEPAFIRKRNERERQRVKCVNEGYTRLRDHLPEEYAEKRLSKVETLRGAIMYINQLQSLLGFEPEKASKVKKCGDNNDLQSQNSEDQSRLEGLENGDRKTNAIEEKAIAPGQDSRNSSDNYDRAKKIELDTDELVKSPYAHNDYKNCKEHATRSGACRNTATARFSPCTASQQDASSRSESPRFCTRVYSPNVTATTSPHTNCAIPEGNISSKSCALEERASCISNEIIINSSNPATGEIAREPLDWWDRVCNKSQMSSIFDLVEDCSLNANKHIIQTHSENSWPSKNSRHHPYKRLELRNNTLTDNWDDVFQIKVETHTPPPYDDRSEFSCQQQYSSCQRVFTKTRQSRLRSNHNAKDAQSDGFKTDTSPESLTGLSP